MRKILPVVSVLGFLAAGGAVTWSVLSRPDTAHVAPEAADSFNLQTEPAPTRAPALGAGAAPVATSSLTRPLADSGMAVGGLRKSPEAMRYTVVTPKAEAWARRHEFFTGLIANPAGFLMSRSSLGSARALRAFLSSPRKVDAFMDSALVRITLNSPAVAKAVLGNPAVIRAFLATPALRDSQTVGALVSSPMFRKMLDCPAIQEALGDPVVMQRMIGDPQTVSWLAAHPDALMAVVEAAPALGGAFTAKTGR